VICQMHRNQGVCRETNLLGKQLTDLLLVLRWCVLLLGCKVISKHMLHGQADLVSV
jgi:hypothetical protein